MTRDSLGIVRTEEKLEEMKIKFLKNVMKMVLPQSKRH